MFKEAPVVQVRELLRTWLSSVATSAAFDAVHGSWTPVRFPTFQKIIRGR